MKEEVADLAAKQKDLEKSLQTSATSSDLEARGLAHAMLSRELETRLEALRDIQKAADEQLVQARLEISEVRVRCRMWMLLGCLTFLRSSVLWP